MTVLQNPNDVKWHYQKLFIETRETTLLEYSLSTLIKYFELDATYYN